MTTDLADREQQSRIPELDANRRGDDTIIKGVSLAIVGFVVIVAMASAETAADAIGDFRTGVTQYFTWYFVVLATLALLFCVYMAASRRGKIVFGGPNAKPEYGHFALYSMLFA